jgi:predicted TIM-barrel fold metal-dependent hydrolase
MARIPFVDTHFHLHDMKHAELRYVWLEPDAVHSVIGEIGTLKSQHYRIENFLAEIRFSNVPKAIHVQAALGTKDPVAETRWLQAIADRAGYPHGIIAECRLAEPDAEAVLERHMAYRNVRGIRNYLEGDYLSHPAWQSGYKALGKHGLIGCVNTRWQQFPQAKALARQTPGTVMCIDHCAIPESRDPEYFARWRDGLRDLAEAENVIVKVSGLGLYDWLWTVDSIRPWVLACIDAFGTKRTVFASNWPVDRMFSSYPDLINAYAAIVSDFTEDEQRDLFARNAERIFRV